jgi:hypothetical protein
MALWGNRDSFAITGTIGVPNASTTVTGVGTTFTTQLQAGQAITIASVKYKIAKITDNTHLELVIPYAGTTIASGATITGQDSPKWILQQDLATTFFVDETEAKLAANHNKGINGAGWWDIREYKDSAGASRAKCLLLVAMTTAAATSGDAADDALVADVNAVVTITVQPTTQAITAGAATLSVTATVAPSGTVTYQWQKALAANNTKFANLINNGTVSGALTNSLALTGQLAAAAGDRYRVVVSSDSGAVKVNSNAVALTFVS